MELISGNKKNNEKRLLDAFRLLPEKYKEVIITTILGMNSQLKEIKESEKVKAESCRLKLVR